MSSTRTRAGAAVVTGALAVAVLTHPAAGGSAVAAGAVGRQALHTCQYQSVTLGPQTRTLIPRQLYNGDRDFDGNGPAVRLRAALYPGAVVTDTTARGTLELSLDMSAVETEADHTAAAESRGTRVYTAPVGWFVTLPLPLTDTHTFTYTDTDHTDDVFTFGTASFVNRYTFVGDTVGAEAGTHTGVTVLTRAMVLRLSTCIDG